VSSKRGITGNNTAGKYLYPHARNVIAAYYTNNDYISLQRIPYNYGYSRATMTSQPLDTLGEPKPLTSSNAGISGQPCEKTVNDIQQTTILANEPKPCTTYHMESSTLCQFQSALGEIFLCILLPDYLALMVLI
jgi:hypothetical protein